MNVVNVKWNGKRRFVGWDEAGHGVVMDAPASETADGSGARPVELVLYALAGCTGMDVISILEKKRQVVTDLQLVVRGTQREDGDGEADRTLGRRGAAQAVEDDRERLSLGEGGKRVGDAGPDRHGASLSAGSALVRGISASAQGP